jgi:hypothetical protein
MVIIIIIIIIFIINVATPSIQWGPNIFPGVKRPGREFFNERAPTSEVKNGCSYTSTALYAIMPLSRLIVPSHILIYDCKIIKFVFPVYTLQQVEAMERLIV